MAEEKNMRQAQAAFTSLCAMLDSEEWHYEKNEGALAVECMARGDDLPIPIRITVDADRLLVVLVSQIPFIVPENKRNEMSLAVSTANFGIVDGCFDYNYDEGTLGFRMTSSFRESLVGKELFEYMLYVSCQTVDVYNDKFFRVAKTDMTFDEVIGFISNRGE